MLTQGQGGYLSWQCLTNYGTYCPSAFTETWESITPGGFSSVFIPSQTTGSEPVQQYIVAYGNTAPGLYPFYTYYVGSYNTIEFLVQVVASQPPPNPPPPGNINKQILNEAVYLFSIGASTAAGPRCYKGDPLPGDCACAWEINNILASFGLKKLGANTNLVPSLEADLKAGRGVLVPISQAQPGDIDVQADQGHIGVCITVHCTTVYSTSSSHGKFSTNDGPSIFLPASEPGRIYRVIK